MTTATLAAAIALSHLPLDQLTANEFALRGVDLEDPDVLRMFDNIKEVGVLTPIRVRPAMSADGKSPKMTDDGRPIYYVIDGLHRYTGAVRGRLETVPAFIVTADDAEVEKQQLMANLHRIPTKPYEYGKHLKRILGRDQTKSKTQLAHELNVSEDFIEKRMGLGGLHKDGVDDKGEPTSSIGVLVDQGKIVLANAVELAKLKPSELQLDFVTQAMTMPTLQFGKLVKDKMKQLREAKQQGRQAGETVEWTPSPHLRKKEEIAAEAQSAAVISHLLRAQGIDPTEEVLRAVKFALTWAVQLDEQSKAKAKADHDAKERERAAEIAERKAERAKKAQVEAEAAKVKAQAAVGAQTA